MAEKFSRTRFAAAGDEMGGLGLVLALETMVVGITGKNFFGVRSLHPTYR
jgi:hypothetical protein